MAAQTEEKIICPKCGNPCSWINEEKGSLWCYHYEGIERDEDGRVRKKVKKHYLGKEKYTRGRPGEQKLSEIEDEIKEIEEELKTAKSKKKKKKLEEEKKKLEEEKQQLQERTEKANIHLRPVSDKNRFIEYIKESLELMQFQSDFDDKKIVEVLQILEDFLKKNLQYAGTFIPALRRIEEDLLAEARSKQ